MMLRASLRQGRRASSGLRRRDTAPPDAPRASLALRTIAAPRAAHPPPEGPPGRGKAHERARASCPPAFPHGTGTGGGTRGQVVRQPSPMAPAPEAGPRGQVVRQPSPMAPAPEAGPRGQHLPGTPPPLPPPPEKPTRGTRGRRRGGPLHPLALAVYPPGPAPRAPPPHPPHATFAPEPGGSLLGPPRNRRYMRGIRANPAPTMPVLKGALGVRGTVRFRG